MNATPIMCQYAEIVLSPAVIRMSNTLIRHAAMRQIAYMTKMEKFADAPNQSFMCAE